MPCLPISLSLSLGVDRTNKSGLFSSLSLFFFFFFLSFSQICFVQPFCHCVTYNTFFFFFLIPLSLSLCYIVCVYIYTYIFLIFLFLYSAFCLINLLNYNVYYEFSNFCFCVYCYSFIYLLKLIFLLCF